MRKVIILFIALFSCQSWAHVRWFIDAAEVESVSLPQDSLALGILLFVLSFCFIIQFVTKVGLLGGFTAKPILQDSFILWRFLTFVMALFFILNLILGEFVAPNLQLLTGQEWIGVVLQVSVVALMAVSVSVGGLIIVLLAFSLFLLQPFSVAIDYFPELLAIGTALVVIGPQLNSMDQGVFGSVTRRVGGRAFAVKQLRFLLGLQLFILGIHNKMMLPGLSLAFVEAYPHYNFVQLLGWSEFSHIHFVWFVGVSETLLGVMLMLGFATRCVMSLLAVIFVTTTIVSGPAEVLGHMPIFAVAFILLSESTSGSLVSDKSTTKERESNTCIN
ncbi:hypothetical protein [Vibrio sp. WXL210]|uniref:hypothetical protein n=1 Tax=Vibrio sp. WXL210 TaxID=3450709 RepID=UPI003EC9442B